MKKGNNIRYFLFDGKSLKQLEFDLTASRLFIDNVASHYVVVRIVDSLDKKYKVGQSTLGLGPAIELLFRCLYTIHRLWRQKSYFSDTDLFDYTSSVSKFGWVWSTLQWNMGDFYKYFFHLFFSFVFNNHPCKKVSTWVHWLVRHSVLLAKTHRSFYLFSSIPTERRNVEFKLDVRKMPFKH